MLQKGDIMNNMLQKGDTNNMLQKGDTNKMLQTGDTNKMLQTGDTNKMLQKGDTNKMLQKGVFTQLLSHFLVVVTIFFVYLIPLYLTKYVLTNLRHPQTSSVSESLNTVLTCLTIIGIQLHECYVSNIWYEKFIQLFLDGSFRWRNQTSNCVLKIER